MTEVNIKDIRSSYGVDRPNDSFINEIVRNICDDNIFEVQGISLDFCETPEERCFWKKNILNKYAYLFPYLVINKWQINDPTNEEIAKWIECFLKEKVVDEKGKTFDDKLYDEVKLFKEDTTIIHEIPNIIPQIGFIIDSYLWLYHKENLFFVRYIEGKLPLTDTLYHNYFQFFKKQICTYDLDDIKSNIIFILDYCEATDLLFRQNSCFLSLIEKLSTSDSKNMRLSSLIKTISQNKCDIETLKSVLFYYCINIGFYKDSMDSEIQFCRTSHDALFWKNIITNQKCETFLAYLFLSQWSADNPDIYELKTWLQLFQSDQHLAIIESNMWNLKKTFRNEKQKIPKTIGEYVGYVIDKYLWEKYVEIPSFIYYFDSNNPFLQRYREIPINSVRKDKQHFINNIDGYLQYCLLIDTKIIHEEYVFIEVLKLVANNNSDNLANILHSIPYHGDKFGLSLLSYCKENYALYNISERTIDEYEYLLSVDSWINKLFERLGNKGKPYDIELCKNTTSHRKIVKYLNFRHSEFWNKCNNAAMQVLEEVKKRNPSDKRNLVRNEVLDKMKKLCKKEKELIHSDVNALVKKAIKEGIGEYINIVKSSSMENGEKIELTDKVYSVVYHLLIKKYTNFELPQFPFETGADFLPYADKFSRVWVFRWLIGDDMINSINEVNSSQLFRIKRTFDSSIWEKIQEDVFNWCTMCYGGVERDLKHIEAEDSIKSYSTSSNFDYDYDIPFYANEPYTG